MVTMHSSRMMFLGAVFAGLGVAAGAFGAHMLKPVLDTTLLGVFETAVRYPMDGGLHTARGYGPDSRLGTVGMDCRDEAAIGQGVQDAVRLPLIDPQPPWELTKVPSSRCPSLENSRLSS